MRLSALLPIAFILLATSAQAEGDGAEACNAILSYGLRDNFSVLSAKAQSDLFRHTLCDTNYSDYEAFHGGAERSGFSVGFAEYSLGLSGSSESKENEFTTKYRKYCDADFGTSSSRTLFMFHREDVNDALVSGWNRCHSDYLAEWASRRKTDVYASVSMSDRFDHFTLDVQRISGRNDPISFPSADLGGAHCTYGEGQELKGGFSAKPNEGNTLVFSCSKRAFDSARITLQTPDGATEPVTVPAETNRIAGLESEITDLRLGLQAMTNKLGKWGRSTGATPSQRGVPGGGTSPGGPIMCPDGQYLAGLEAIKEDGGGYCSGCINGFTLVCRPLNLPENAGDPNAEP